MSAPTLYPRLGRGRGGCVSWLRPAPVSRSRPPPPPEREVSVLGELRSLSAREGDSATFECTVSESETTGRWELGGRALRPGGRVRIRQEGVGLFLPSVTPCYLAQGSGRLRPIQLSPASSLSRPRPTNPLLGSSGLSSAASSESCLAPFGVLSPIPRAETLRNLPGTLLGCHSPSRILPGSG